MASKPPHIKIVNAIAQAEVLTDDLPEANPREADFDILANASGLPKDLAGVGAVFRSAPEFRNLFGYDEMQRESVLFHPILALENVRKMDREARKRFPVLNRQKPVLVEDIDILKVQEFLQQAGMAGVNKRVVEDAIRLRASRMTFHPVRDWFNSLRWDGTERLESWLTTYLGAEASPYTQEIGPMFLVGMVARIFKPGCPMNYMLVLEGPQGCGKSTACRILGGEWFSDCLPDVDQNNTDVSLHLNGKMLIEVAELSAMSRAEAGKLKAFLTRNIEKYRRKWGSKDVEEPRQCVFVGTTNKDVYLRDETGGRRFWPVRVGTIDTDALARDRDQLFAEAVAKFNTGFRWWPDGDFEAAHIKPQQEARREDDGWEDLIRDYLENRDVARVTEVGLFGIKIESQRLSVCDQRRIADLMLGIGWERRRMDSGGNRWFGRPGLSDEDYRRAVKEARRSTTDHSTQRTTAHFSFKSTNE